MLEAETQNLGRDCYVGNARERAAVAKSLLEMYHSREESVFESTNTKATFPVRAILLWLWGRFDPRGLSSRCLFEKID
jgi:hypothetical protein